MTDKNFRILKDARYDATVARRYVLALNISHTAITAIASEVATGVVHLFAEQTFDDVLTDAELTTATRHFLDHEICNTVFAKVRVIVVGNKSTLVPGALMDNGKMQKFLAFNHDVDEDETDETCTVKNGSITFVFAVPVGIRDLVRQKFAGCTFYHQASPLIDAILISLKNKVTRKKIFVSVEHDFFDLVVVSGETLLLHNTFSFQSETDLVYYLMSVFEQMKMNPQVNEVTFSGNVEYDSPAVNLTKRFVKNVYFVSFKDERDRIGYAFDQLQLYKYTNILNVFKCE